MTLEWVSKNNNECISIQVQSTITEAQTNHGDSSDSSLYESSCASFSDQIASTLHADTTIEESKDSDSDSVSSCSFTDYMNLIDEDKENCRDQSELIRRFVLKLDHLDRIKETEERQKKERIHSARATRVLNHCD